MTHEIDSETRFTRIESFPGGLRPGPATTKRKRFSRVVVGRRTLMHRTRAYCLQLERVKCGKATCRRCPHGPYWYVYWSEAGRDRSAYIGRRLGSCAEVLAIVERARRGRAKKKVQS
jgi:hypothetical protein